MSRDYLSDIDRLGRQLAELRAIFSKQAGSAADHVGERAVQRSRQFAQTFQREAPRVLSAVKRNPSAATGAVVVALALGTVIGLFLAGASSNRK
jgi:tellurite resistance protein